METMITYFYHRFPIPDKEKYNIVFSTNDCITSMPTQINVRKFLESDTTETSSNEDNNAMMLIID